MTGCDHEHSSAVVVAAQWLADQRDPPRPVIPELRRRFPLDIHEACEAAALAHRFRATREALE